MKVVLSFIILFASSYINSFSQVSATWSKSFGGSLEEKANAINKTNDGGFILAGYSFSYDGELTLHYANEDYWVVKLDSGGNLQWQKTLGGSWSDIASDVIQTMDGGFIVAGQTESGDFDVSVHYGPGALGWDFWIVKLDTIGNIEWEKTLGGSQMDEPYSIKQLSDGGYIVAGSTNSSDSDVTCSNCTTNNSDMWLVRLNSSGNILWQKSYGSQYGAEIATSLQVTNDGGFVLAGFSSASGGDVSVNRGEGDFWIVKTDSLGTLEWESSAGGSLSEIVNSIIQTNDGGYLAAGYSHSNDSDVTGHHGSTYYEDFWVLKLDSTGIIEWEKSLGGSFLDVAKSVLQTTDGDYLISGYSFSSDGDITNPHGSYDAWLVKLDNAGNLIWQNSIGGIGYNISNSLIEIAANELVVAGTSSFDSLALDNHGSYDFWAIKLGTPVNIYEVQTPIKQFFITPNPFSFSTTIDIELMYSSNISIGIFNIQGEEIKSFQNKFYTTGVNILFWEGTNNHGDKVQPGYYLLRIITDRSCETKKICYLAE